jgi:hypothetical protein
MAEKGRPPVWTEDRVKEVGSEICRRLSEGEALVRICKEDGMPKMSTVFDWLRKWPDFANSYAHARELQADAMDEAVHLAALDCTEDNYNSTRVKIDALKWRAAHLRPKKYGDKVHVETDIRVTKVIVYDEAPALPPIIDAICVPSPPREMLLPPPDDGTD